MPIYSDILMLLRYTGRMFSRLHFGSLIRYQLRWSPLVCFYWKDSTLSLHYSCIYELLTSRLIGRFLLAQTVPHLYFVLYATTRQGETERHVLYFIIIIIVIMFTRDILP